MTRRRLPGLILATVAFAFAAICRLGAQGAPRTGAEIKAAYLFTFGRFVEWPSRRSRDNGDFVICVLGVDQFGAVLDSTLAEGSLRDRRPVARRIATQKDARDCHILFISASEERRLDAILQSLGGTDVLTVSDTPDFLARGGMIQFVTAGNRIRFEISLVSAREAGLMLSSELLRVASAVRDARPPGE